MDTTNLSSTLPMNNLSSDERSLKQKMLKAQKGLEKLNLFLQYVVTMTTFQSENLEIYEKFTE